MLKFIWTYIVTFYYILTLKKNLSDDYFYNAKFGFTIARNAVKAAGYKIKIIGSENLPNENGNLYVSNHQSFFDIFASLYFINKQLGFVAKKQLKKFFFVGLYVEKMGGVLIDRDDVRSQVDVLVQLTKNIKAGYNAFIFPEGTRTKDGKLSEFKSGSFKIALKSKCKIVPITFYNNHEVVTNKKDNTIKIKIDKPILFEEYEKMNTGQLSDYIKKMIQVNLDTGFDMQIAQNYEENFSA